MSEAERMDLLPRAGFNVIHLDPADVAVDLTGDALLHAFLEAREPEHHCRERAPAHEPDLGFARRAPLRAGPPKNGSVWVAAIERETAPALAP